MKKPEKPQVKKEEEEKGGFGLSQKIADRLVGSARSIADYAVENLPRLIVDPDTDPPTVVWPEAFERLRQIVKDPDNPTKDEIATVLEELSTGFRYEYLDEMLVNLDDWKIKVAIAAGLSTAKTILKLEPSWVKELQTKRGSLILQMLKHEQTYESYLLLKDRPRLTEFISNYLLIKLGIPLEEKKTVTAQTQTQIQVKS